MGKQGLSGQGSGMSKMLETAEKRKRYTARLHGDVFTYTTELDFLNGDLAEAAAGLLAMSEAGWTSIDATDCYDEPSEIEFTRPATPEEAAQHDANLAARAARIQAEQDERERAQWRALCAKFGAP